MVGNSSSGNSGPVDGVQSSKKKCLSGSISPIALDDFGSDLLLGADEYMDMYYDDLLYDDYAVLQSHFDNMDIPTGVEAPIPWMPQMVSTTTSTSGRDICGAVKDQSTSFTSSTLAGQPTQLGLSWSSSRPVLGKEGQLIIGSSNVKSSEGGSSVKILSSGAGKQLSSHSSSAAASSDQNNPYKFYKESSAQYGKKVRSSSAIPPYDGWGKQSIPSGSHFPKIPMGSPVSDNDLMNLFLNQPTPVSPGTAQTSATMMKYFAQSSHKSATTAGCPPIPSGPACNGEQHRNLGETLKNFRLFKKFDTVEDHSDHFYSQQASSGNPVSLSQLKLKNFK